jgi:[1-hydroxy-2-(trimethylamino)ethyl]phosphonate dioxygenase
MTRQEFLDTICRLFSERGNSLYGGESVTQLQHALQAAELARSAGAPIILGRKQPPP